ncbi:amidohydrolase family protein [Embleya sp. NPDC059237]|uniref:amidohydrolase family protein n=1 Tax=Embleya sp. NPDC059237 TaxID=3346784 RepID=UPI0036C6F74C
MDGTPSLHIHETGSLIEVDDERSGREAVRQVVRDGADFVKVYSRLTPDTYRAIAHESRRLGIPFAGHCPDRLSPAEAGDLGQASIEHMYPIVLATSTREAEIRRELAEVRVDPTDTDPVGRYSNWFRQIHPLEYETVTGHDPRRADALFARFVAHRTRVVPTLAVHRTLELPDENPRSDDTWKYLPSWIVEDWPRQMSIVVDSRTPEQARQIREIHAHRRRLVGRMFRAGVPVLAGTDTGNPYLVPGFALHRELELLVACGLSPLRALQAATREPAALLGAASTLGTVEPGRLADLVVLDADPLCDIRNTTAIHAVVVDGRLIDDARRSALLAEVQHAASTTPPPAPEAAPPAGCACDAH